IPSSNLVCVRTSGDLCAAIDKGSVTVGDTNNDGISGAITSQTTNSQLAGACPFVVTCNCNGEQKQQCLNQNIYNASQVESHCAQNICPAIGTNGKVCDPGTVKCLDDGSARGYVCKNDGSGFNESP